MSRVEALFDRLFRLHALATWAGDDVAAWVLEDLLVFLPSLVTMEPEGEQRNLLDAFWRRMEAGAYEALVQPAAFWNRVEAQARDAHVRNKRAKRLVDLESRRTLDERNPKELVMGRLVLSDRESQVLMELTSRATEKSRGWTEADMHALIHFQPQNVPHGLRADQFAVVTASLLGRKAQNRPAAPERDSWARVRELSQEARRLGLRWTWSGAEDPAIRLCGYSLTGTVEVDFVAATGSGVQFLEREGETILLIETDALVLRLHVFSEGGIVRGSAVARMLEAPDTVAETLERTLARDVSRILRAGPG
ncbi:hypothetical protein VZQ01_40130 [Myxococcus faecalis]|uniref:hypothetical protein n=1 Tax=Myxococcus faecalis TaxID=3115646 RepID=UPI003CEC56B8